MITGGSDSSGLVFAADLDMEDGRPVQPLRGLAPMGQGRVEVTDQVRARRIALDEMGHVTLALEISGALGPTGPTTTQHGDWDALAVGFEGKSEPQWAHQMGGMPLNSLTGLAVAPDGSVALAAQLAGAARLTVERWFTPAADLAGCLVGKAGAAKMCARVLA